MPNSYARGVEEGNADFRHAAATSSPRRASNARYHGGDPGKPTIGNEHLAWTARLVLLKAGPPPARLATEVPRDALRCLRAPLTPGWVPACRRVATICFADAGMTFVNQFA